MDGGVGVAARPDLESGASAAGTVGSDFECVQRVEIRCDRADVRSQRIPDRLGYQLLSIAHLSDVLISMGCQYRDVTAPGRCFRLGNGPSVHLHPKQSYIVFGLPRRMQEDVEALRAYPRRKNGPARVRYGPHDVDGDTEDGNLSCAHVRFRTVWHTHPKGIGCVGSRGGRMQETGPATSS